MDALSKLKKSLWAYISPRKTQQHTMAHKTGRPEPAAINFLDERRKEQAESGERQDERQKVINGRIAKNTGPIRRTSNVGMQRVVRQRDEDLPILNLTDSETSTNDASDPQDSEYEPESVEDPEETETVILPARDSPDDEPTFVNDDDEYKENRKLVEEYSEDEEESLDLKREDLTITLATDQATSSEESEVNSQDKVMNYLSNQSVAPQGSPVDKSSRPNEHDFHPDEAALWARLEARGTEPLLPLHWAQDFRTFTADFFSSDLEETFINSASGKDFQAIKALLSLIALGPLVRERRQAGLPREVLIGREFRSYMRWAERDGGYVDKTFIPIHAIVEARPGMSIRSITASLEAQLSLLAHHHRQFLRVPARRRPSGPVSSARSSGPASATTPVYRHAPPLLYGILIVRAKVIVCTMDASGEAARADVRTLAAFDFQETEMDIWNAFALAIVAVTVRNRMMHLRELGDLSAAADEEAAEEDPDL